MAYDSSNNFISNDEIKDLESAIVEIANTNGSKIKKSRTSRKKSERNKKDPLRRLYNEENNYELGVDEAGRGPLFGRVYVAGVIIPKDDHEFKYDIIKDSKRFSSKKKLKEVYEYIKENCVDYYVTYRDETYIDTHNIRQSVLDSMNECIVKIKTRPDFVLIDGCDFVNKTDDPDLRYTCIEGGDNWYVSIAAASILAKVERDAYVEELCEKHPELEERYGISSNKGYGTKKHIDGIKNNGITQFHRKSYGICKQYV
jgi:ribonuclease HII